MKYVLSLSFSLVVFALLSGCATRPNLIARSGGSGVSTNDLKVAFIAQPHPRPEDQLLMRNVTSELGRRGFRLVESTNADFLISCGVEDNWLTRQVESRESLSGANMTRSEPYFRYPNGLMERRDAAPYTPSSEEGYIRVQGIRMRVYSAESLRQRSFEMAWEGYVEAGLQLRPEQQPALLRALFDYFGHDFVGHVKIEK